jgi:hypothetical protein
MWRKREIIKSGREQVEGREEEREKLEGLF